MIQRNFSSELAEVVAFSQKDSSVGKREPPADPSLSHRGFCSRKKEALRLLLAFHPGPAFQRTPRDPQRDFPFPLFLTSFWFAVAAPKAFELLLDGHKNIMSTCLNIRKVLAQFCTSVLPRMFGPIGHEFNFLTGCREKKNQPPCVSINCCSL